MKFSIKDFFSKCDKIRRFLRIWSHLLKKSFMENFIFCVVCKRLKICSFSKRLLSAINHCVKSVRIRSYSSPHFPAFGLNTDQNNSEYGPFLRSELFGRILNAHVQYSLLFMCNSDYLLLFNPMFHFHTP